MTDLDRTVPDDAYAALGDETRLEILFELSDHYDAAWSAGWLSFSNLCDRVGVDDTSRFNYHLKKLQDEFVVKENEQYRPTIAALEVVTAIRSGTYDSETAMCESVTDERCPHCEQPMVARHDKHLLLLACPDHGATLGYPVPPVATSHQSLEALVELALRRHAADIESVRHGVCPYCWGPATISFPREMIPELYLQLETVYATVACEACWMSYPVPIPSLLGAVPAVIALYDDHGLAPLTMQRGSTALSRVSEVELLENGMAEVTISLEETGLTVVIDGDGTVKRCQRID